MANNNTKRKLRALREDRKQHRPGPLPGKSKGPEVGNNSRFAATPGQRSNPSIIQGL